MLDALDEQGQVEAYLAAELDLEALSQAGVTRSQAFEALRFQVRGSGDHWLDRFRGKARLQRASEVAPMALALSHDVDFVTSRTPLRTLRRRIQRLLLGKGPLGYGVKSALGSLYRALTEFPRRERYGDLSEWMDLEDSRGLRSTFFFLPYGDGGLHVYDGDYRFSDRILFDGRMVRLAEVVRELHQGGWEIGLHGTIRSATEPGLLARQKGEIERIISAPIVSVRQHYLRYEPEITPHLQASAGFRFDSTHGLNDAFGAPTGTSHPYALWDPVRKVRSPLMELPLLAMDSSMQTSQRQEEGRGELIRALEGVFNQVQEARGILVANWHPHYLPEGLTRESYEWVMDTALARGAFVGTIREVGTRYGAFSEDVGPA